MEQSVEALAAIPARMCEAWAHGDAEAFFADFADDAEFVEFEGTIHRGRRAMVEVTQPIFDTVMQGARLVDLSVPLARVVRPGVGALHARMGILMPGEEKPPPYRYSMQMSVVLWQNDRWEVVAMQNSRLLPMESAMALEPFTTP